jgi:hypothetical protein
VRDPEARGKLACQPKLAEETREGSGGERRLGLPAVAHPRDEQVEDERRLGWVTGFEPATSGATVRRSTAELYPPQAGQHYIIAPAGPRAPRRRRRQASCDLAR